MTQAAKNELQTAINVLQPIQVGSMQLAVFENEVLSIEPWREPTRLPFAPEPVLGVVSIQGRMLTVVDTAKLLSIDSAQRRFIVALRGKEQLALTIDASTETIRIAADNIQAPLESSPALIKGIIQHGPHQLHLLALKELFATAMRGHERRRRRF
jgi:purine-binding chemotaxis protein CheW